MGHPFNTITAVDIPQSPPQIDKEKALAVSRAARRLLLVLPAFDGDSAVNAWIYTLRRAVEDLEASLV